MNLIGGHGRERHVVKLIVRPIGLETIREVTDVADQACGVFDGIAATGRQRGMRRLAMHPATKQIDALVGHDDLHAGRFTHHAAFGPDAAIMEIGDQIGRASAAHLLVIGEGQMNRLGARHGQVFGDQGQRRGDKALHVARPAAIKPPVGLIKLERVRGPILPIDRDHIGVPGKHDTALGIAIRGRQRGEKIRLIALRAMHQPGLNTLLPQPIAAGFYQSQIRVPAGGVETNQRFQPSTCVHVARP